MLFTRRSPKNYTRIIALTLCGVMILTIHLMPLMAQQTANKVKTTNPAIKDTDGDGFMDGPDRWVGEYGSTRLLYAGEDKNGNGKYEPKGEDGRLGTDDDETDPNDPTSYPETDMIIAIDDDGDLTSNNVENSFKTFSDDFDSDDDGVSDTDEIYKYFTKPRIADSDYDGLTDGFELGLTNTTTLDTPESNEYNSFWFNDINLEKSYRLKLPGADKDDDYLTLKNYQSCNSAAYRSDPMSFDSDYDGVNDYEEWQNGTDPMRGIVRKQTIEDVCPRSVKLGALHPPIIIRFPPITRDFKICLNLEFINDETIAWMTELPVCLGQSGQPITLSVETIPSGPEHQSAFLYAEGAYHDEYTISSEKLVARKEGRYNFQNLEFHLFKREFESVKLKMDLGGGEVWEYVVGINKYYIHYSDIYGEYLDQLAEEEQ